MDQGLPVYSVTADLQGSTGVKPFHADFPENYTDVGVAESNMINAGAGCSKAGLIPIVDTFAQFGVTKGNLPLTMASLSQAPVISVFSHTGFQDAADGASHQATTYFSAVSSIPHTTVISCYCSAEAESLMTQAIEQFASDRRAGKTPDNMIFFVGRENFPQHLDNQQSYQWGKAQILKDFDEADVVLVGTGPMTHKVFAAQKSFEAEGIKAIVINNSFINQIDTDTIGKALKRAKGRLITLEDHQTIGGMGSLLAHSLLTNGYQFEMRSLGMQGEFGQSAYLADQLYDKYGMNFEGLKKAYQSF